MKLVVATIGVANGVADQLRPIARVVNAPIETVVQIEQLNDQTFELRLTLAIHNVDAIVVGEHPTNTLIRQISDRRGVYLASTNDLIDRIAEMHARAATPNIDYEWPE